MPAIDLAVTSWCNQFVRHSEVFDRLIEFIGGSNLLKGGVLLAVWWWAWFHDTERFESSQAGAGLLHRRRQSLLLSLATGVVAVALARVLALSLPLRLRPLHDASLNLQVAYGVTPTDLDGWSSFPSDHATLFFALSMGLFFAFRRLGLCAMAYTLLFICLPRIYLGYHYLSDIVVGALIGVGAAWWAQQGVLRQARWQAFTTWFLVRPQWLYPGLFLLTYQMADLFAESRALLGFAHKLWRLLGS